MDYCSGVRRNELLIQAKTRMNLRNMILSERSLSQKLIQTKVMAFSCFLKKKGNYTSHCDLFLMNSYWSPVFASFSSVYGASLLAQMVKNLSAMWKTWFRYLGWDDPLEKGMATHSSILAWRIPWTEMPHGVTKSQTRLSDLSFFSVYSNNLNN